MKCWLLRTALLCCGIAAKREHGTVHHLASRSGPAWTVVGPAFPDELVEIVFALTHTNVASLERAFWHVSDPLSPEYGVHWTKEELSALLQPKERNVALVSAFITQHTTIPPQLIGNGDFLRAQMTVSAAERALNCSGCFHIFQSGKGPLQKRYIRSVQPFHRPYALQDPETREFTIDFVADLCKRVPFPSEASGKLRSRRLLEGSEAETARAASEASEAIASNQYGNALRECLRELTHQAANVKQAQATMRQMQHQVDMVLQDPTQRMRTLTNTNPKDKAFTAKVYSNPKGLHCMSLMGFLPQALSYEEQKKHTLFLLYCNLNKLAAVYDAEGIKRGSVTYGSVGDAAEVAVACTVAGMRQGSAELQRYQHVLNQGPTPPPSPGPPPTPLPLPLVQNMGATNAKTKLSARTNVIANMVCPIVACACFTFAAWSEAVRFFIGHAA
jgi:hypothetical protein